ncbi:MAG: hypothetical protein A3B37_01730 [Candidatus Sungbacteria bacterium RIFCSPLOWO2_01_FULL_59_16]|uniref:Uncharacterized protein n=1 Tax=Candidatus Sungbacteria bacterium RIFCSPLOWO2_01_FULL_59_16 TaxID=1802280 RepID=A0A1G2LAH1_9BACT|nr:MAG: hypothetical protein A3B37_01730 [Candidatus Sungbacteria bacterium RIFCSPLOWO2_01_FULL_59_16]
MFLEAKLYCLQVRGMPLTESVRHVLLETARSIVGLGRERQTIQTDDIQGAAWTTLRVAVIGAISGILFHAKIETPTSWSWVQFILDPSEVPDELFELTSAMTADQLEDFITAAEFGAVAARYGLTADERSFVVEALDRYLTWQGESFRSFQRLMRLGVNADEAAWATIERAYGEMEGNWNEFSAKILLGIADQKRADTILAAFQETYQLLIDRMESRRRRSNPFYTTMVVGRERDMAIKEVRFLQQVVMRIGRFTLEAMKRATGMIGVALDPDSRWTGEAVAGLVSRWADENLNEIKAEIFAGLADQERPDLLREAISEVGMRCSDDRIGGFIAAYLS